MRGATDAVSSTSDLLGPKRQGRDRLAEEFGLYFGSQSVLDFALGSLGETLSGFHAHWNHSALLVMFVESH